ncbi:unnamed protein product [Vitrella brassicaformis CCMP3155]|uniref:Uncharacterized protein n=2 Tax=Vitrella brassicaformis TaxID=1169539 RepID=A0A0G4G596_VITBC|nr:unnamed protein product [Vitrella brassicaformis CCMP3155]|eukprot:CEM23713.1 unnamed protein product [Vitrella brassicaformis CCMP3155]
MAASAPTQLPDGWLRLDDIDIIHSEGGTASSGTRQLADGIIRRTFTHPQQVTDLMEERFSNQFFDLMRHRADPNAELCLCVRGDSVHYGLTYRLLQLAIDNFSDNAISTVHVRDGSYNWHPVALPHWSSPELETAILNALIDGGANVDEPISTDDRPIRMAVRGGNVSAVEVLLARGAAVRRPHSPTFVMELPRLVTGRVGIQVSPGYEERLLSIYRRLLQRDGTLATEGDQRGLLIHSAANSERGSYSQEFIDSYLDLLVENGADVTAVDWSGWTPLHNAARAGSSRVADFLGRHVPAADINRGTTGHPNTTPLKEAASQLDDAIRRSQDASNSQHLRDRATSEIPPYEAIIRSLLRSGADVSRIPRPRAPVWRLRRRCRELVLTRYTTMLNTDVHTGAMAAVNAALAPQRSLAAFLMRSLPTLLPHLLQPPGTPAADPPPAPNGYGPHEAEAIGWKIAAMCFDWDAAVTTISGSIGLRNSALARRITAAAEHFVKSAVFEASSNREVVGGTRQQQQQQGNKRVKVIVPRLQCFAVNGGQHGTHRRLGLSEVVHRARLDEAARHGMEEGAITHLGAADCEFGGWQQLGRIDERGQWVTLGIN